jgi:hypothetical protein
LCVPSVLTYLCSERWVCSLAFCVAANASLFHYSQSAWKKNSPKFVQTEF